MTPEEFKNKMREIYPENGYVDSERAHSEADDLIVKLLIELGYAEGAKIFDEADKWYA